MYRQLVVEAAFLHTKPDCYFVGSYAQRVSFASQQIRALDLISGLRLVREEDFARREPLIAVVGAGLAGMMATSALREIDGGAGRIKVHMYEFGDDVLTKHRDASHRLVHPTINRWPFEPIEHSSALPMFNWCAIACDKVMAQVRKEWEGRKPPPFLPPKGRRTVPLQDFMMVSGVRVERIDSWTDPIAFDAAEKSRLVLDKTVNGLTDSQGVVKHKYDLVIVATGYGIENRKVHATTKTYWQYEELESEIQAESRKHDAHKRNYYVTGCGDGGLVDLLRIMHGDFNAGWLTVMAAKALEGTAIAREIKAAEFDALRWARSIFTLEPDIAVHPAGAIRPDKMDEVDTIVSRRLQPVYQQLVARLNGHFNRKDSREDRAKYDAVSKVLNQSLEKVRMANHVFLVAPLPAPYKPFAAPIHKLLIAHALSQGKFAYRQGQQTDNYLTLTGHTTVYGADPMVRIIPRHGTDASETGILLKDERRSLRLRQVMLADWIRSARDDDLAYTNPLAAKPAQGEKLDLYFNHIRDLFTAMDDRFELTLEENGLACCQRGESTRPSENCARILGYDHGVALDLPEKVFGTIDIRRGGVPDFPVLGGDPG